MSLRAGRRGIPSRAPSSAAHHLRKGLAMPTKSHLSVVAVSLCVMLLPALARAAAPAGSDTSAPSSSAPPAAAAPVDEDLARQIFETMLKVHGVADGHRPVHAKGIVCTGIFTATPQA